MNILITGGAGFIGSHLVGRLLNHYSGPKNENLKITIYDNLSLGKKEFVKNHLSNPNIKLVEEDLLNFQKINNVMKGVDLVCHLAANSDIANDQHTDTDLKNGTLATYNVLEAMRLNNVKEIIFASSSAIYGEAKTKPTPESYGPLLPISFYGASKLACEGLLKAFSHNFGLKVWVYRFANIVGANSTHGAIHDFIFRLKENPKILKVLGNGTQKKSYLHVDDCIDGMIFGYEKSKDDFQHFNLASDGITEVKYIAETVVKKMSRFSNNLATLEYGSENRGWKSDVPYTHLDSSKLGILGWQAKLASNSAIEKAVEDILNV